MSLHVFFIRARSPEPAQSDLNTLLSQGRVLTLHREWLADGANSGWAVCVELVDGPGPLPTHLKHSLGGGAQRGKGGDLDYKEILSEADFVVYARLRETRKQLAQAEGVPLYAVCSNEQMAAMVTQRVATLSDMAALDGMGQARMARYGNALLQALGAQANGSKDRGAAA